MVQKKNPDNSEVYAARIIYNIPISKQVTSLSSLSFVPQKRMSN